MAESDWTAHEPMVEGTSGAQAGRRVAVVVGVNEAPQADVASLHYAESHAQAVAALLTESACQFTLHKQALLGEHATSAAVKDALLALADELGPDDLLLFYFSGHGQPMTIEAERKDVYLVTHDFSERRVARDENFHLSLRWLQDKVLQGSDAGGVVLVLDCCYAGGIGEVAPDSYFEDLRQRLAYYLNVQSAVGPHNTGEMRWTLAAAGPSATTLEADGRGQFTKALLEALGGADPESNGRVMVQSIERYLKHALPTEQACGLYGFDRSRRFYIAYHPDLSAARRRQREEAERRQQHAEEKRFRLHAMLADHSGFMRDRLESFVGRHQELENIRQRIAEKLPTGGYVTITGQTGQGKSSVIAKLVDEYGTDNVAHHFIPFNPGPDHQVSLLRNLMARLILKHDLSDIYVASA